MGPDVDPNLVTLEELDAFYKEFEINKATERLQIKTFFAKLIASRKEETQSCTNQGKNSSFWI